MSRASAVGFFTRNVFWQRLTLVGRSAVWQPDRIATKMFIDRALTVNNTAIVL